MRIPLQYIFPKHSQHHRFINMYTCLYRTLVLKVRHVRKGHYTEPGLQYTRGGQSSFCVHRRVNFTGQSPVMMIGLITVFPHMR